MTASAYTAFHAAVSAALWMGALEQRLQAVVSLPRGSTSASARCCSRNLINGGAFIETSSEFQFIPNLFREFGDADIASLICPRAFFVEDGKHDGAVWWPNAIQEFKLVEARLMKVSAYRRSAASASTSWDTRRSRKMRSQISRRSHFSTAG